MNNLLLEIENTRVPIMLIGLSERNLLEGNRKLIVLTAIILLRYLIFEVILKGIQLEKEIKEEQKNLKMTMCRKSHASK